MLVRAVEFNMVKCMTKDSATATLSTLVDAKNHMDKWPSSADDSGEAFRNVIHFLQRAVNSYVRTSRVEVEPLNGGEIIEVD